MEAKARARAPRWYGIPARVLLVTFIFTLLTFAVGLLVGIVGVVIASRARGLHPDISVAYRYVALPVAVITGAIVLVLALVMEIRHYRQAKALAEIARVS
jgi:TRAP-type C4-dicarboxylate transport system permease small subunit